MKTPEEMAEEYCREWWGNYLVADYLKSAVKAGFLGGYQAAKDQLADASKVINSSNNSNGWISVKDRLPEDKRGVIYWHDEFGANVGHYDSTYPKQNYHWWSYNFGDSADFRVKWWMPLPEAPKEEK